MNRPVPASQRVAAIFAATILLERLRRERPREETARLCSDSTICIGWRRCSQIIRGGKRRTNGTGRLLRR